MGTNAIAAGQGAWRFVTGTSLAASVDGSKLAGGFCIEAWVQVASMARAVRVFSQENYADEPVELSEGRYNDLSGFRFSGSLAGLEMPDDFEVVLFSEVGGQGQAWVYRDDTWNVAAEARTARSAMIFDRRSRMQTDVVLFDAPNWTGRAQALKLAEKQTISWDVRSMLVPPGVEVRGLGSPPLNVRGDAADIGNGFSGREWTAILSNGVLSDSNEIRPGRSVGILTTANGTGLALELVVGNIQSRGVIPTFGGTQLRDTAWHHVAVSWNGDELVYVLDGREVQRSTAYCEIIKLDVLDSWRLGRQLRGSIARVRVWDKFRDAATIRQTRFDDAPNGAIASMAFDETDTNGAMDGVLWTAATLPPNPAQSALYQQMMATVTREHHAAMSAAQAQADEAKQHAAARAAVQLQAARQQARVDIQLHAIAQASFVRGSQFITMSNSGQQFDAHPVTLGGKTEIFVTDTALAGDGANSLLYLAIGYPDKQIVAWNPTTNTLRVVISRCNAVPCAITALSGVTYQDQVKTAIVWIEENNYLWMTYDGLSTCVDGVGSLPSGRPREWDITSVLLDGVIHVVWSNGWEIWRRKGTEPIEILVPHALSPHPVAVNATPDGTLVWVDLDDEVVRSVDLKATPGNRLPRDLYSAPKPGRGIAMGLVAGDSSEIPMLYWVAAERKRIEAAVIDTPGLFLWLDARTDRKAVNNQHVRALRDVHLIGEATWDTSTSTNGSSGLRLSKPNDAVDLGPLLLDLSKGFSVTTQAIVELPYQAEALTLRAEATRLASVAAEKEANAKKANTDAELAERELAQDIAGGIWGPIRAADMDDSQNKRDLATQLQTNAAEARADASEADSRAKAAEVPCPLFTLATTERRDQISFVIEGNGKPSLRMKRQGRELRFTSQPDVHKADALIRSGELSTIAWSISSAGLLSVYVNGDLAYTQQIPWNGDTVLYTANTVGAPPPPRGNVMLSGALLQNDEPADSVRPLSGRINRVLAWNTFVDADELQRLAQDGTATPKVGPDKWDRSLIVDQTEHRFLHAGRIDGSDEPISLFPIELDGGLALVTNLSAGHLALAKAHAEKAAADKHAAELKAKALADARAREETAKQAHAQAASKAAVDITTASNDAAQKRANAEAERKRKEAEATKQLADAKGDAAQRMAKAESDKKDQVATATADKDRRTSAANQRLADKRNERDAKQRQLDDKRAGG